MSISRLKLLLIESDQKVLKEHMNKLTDNKHDVSVTTRPKSGVLMISNGHTYDCIVIEGDKCNDMDLMNFLHQILKLRPKQSIIVMGSKETRQRIAKEADQRYKTISFILKPCDIYTEICRGLQYVVSQRMRFEEGTSNGKLHQRSLAHNIFYRADTLIKPSAIMNTTMINHNIPSSNYGTHGGLNLNSHKYGVMCKPQTYVKASSDLVNNKGKQPILDPYRNKRIDIRPRTAWTRELASDFKTLSGVLNTEKAYPGTYPIMQVIAPGLERNHVASHQQMYHERNNYMKNLGVVEPFQRCNNSQVESYGSRSFQPSTPSTKDASSIIQSSNFPKPVTLNSTGISLMSLDNLQTQFKDFPQLTLPQQTTTTTINNYGADLFQPLIGEASISNALGLFENPKNGTGDQGIHEVQNTVVGYGTGIQPLITTENFSQYSFGNAMAPPIVGETVEPQIKFFNSFDELSQVITGAKPMSSDLGLAENLKNGTGDKGIHEVQNAVVTAGETFSQHTFGNTIAFQFSNGFDELSEVLRGGLVENTDSGNGQGSEVQTEVVVYGIGITPLMTTNDNFSQHETFGEAMATMESEFNFSSGFGTANYGGTCEYTVNEVLAPVDCYGIPIDSWVNHGDSAETTSNDFNLEYLDCPIVENLVDPETPVELNFSDLDAISVANASASPTFSVALNGSADGDLENDWFVRMINHDREISMGGMGEDCGHSINGTIGSEDSQWSI